MQGKHMFVILLLAGNAAIAADTVTVTGVQQRPWIINDGGTLKSATELTVDNPRSQAIDAWVKISVADKPDCLETLGSLVPGNNKRVIHVLELNRDPADPPGARPVCLWRGFWQQCP